MLDKILTKMYYYIVTKRERKKMSIWDKYWFCENFDEENDCCAFCVHPDDCEKLLDDKEEK